MRLSEVLQSHRAAIRGVVAAHRACNAQVFGSVARGLETEGSDLDILVDPAWTWPPSRSNWSACWVCRWMC